MKSEDINIGIIGASGYTGSDLMRIALKHPSIKLKHISANNHAGKNIADLFPHFNGVSSLMLNKWEDLNWNDVDVIFSCLPHGLFHEIISKLPSNKTIIDLSADFRLNDKNLYPEWYEFNHKSNSMLKQFEYGLTEINRENIKKSNLIACPGCYPTATLLGLHPLLINGLILCDQIIIDAKSGLSGAGRTARKDLLYSEVAESIRPYSASGTHRHIPEIEQEINKYSKGSAKINFIPNLVPMNRGELVTMHVKFIESLDINDLYNVFRSSYEGEDFIQILKPGEFANTINVRGTNNCQISVLPSRIENSAVIISSIDNLVKGSSGQAIQNMNLLFGIDESVGLENIALFP
tara:strand:+ start:33901 stop:34950 length:1050 start_codon:yes stop_codon:yes gene_type:complete